MKLGYFVPLFVAMALMVSCAAPTIRDFDIYPEDKVAIEKAEADIELNRKGDVLLTVTNS